MPLINILVCMIYNFIPYYQEFMKYYENIVNIVKK